MVGGVDDCMYEDVGGGMVDGTAGAIAGAIDGEVLVEGNALFAVGIEEAMFGTFVVVYMTTVLSGCVTKIA